MDTPTRMVTTRLLCRVSPPTENTYSGPVLGLSSCSSLSLLSPSIFTWFVFVLLSLSVIFGSSFLPRLLVPHLSHCWKFSDVPLRHFTLKWPIFPHRSHLRPLAKWSSRPQLKELLLSTFPFSSVSVTLLTCSELAFPSIATIYKSNVSWALAVIKRSFRVTLPSFSMNFRRNLAE